MANMEAAEEKNGRNRVAALDKLTGETFSATPGDYFWKHDDEPLRGMNGEPLVLVLTAPIRYLDALTEEEV